MGTNKDFDNILNECLESLLTGDETIDQCLTRYPEQATELRPLLETALSAMKVSNIHPLPEFRERARYQFRTALQEAPTIKSSFSLVWPRWATVVAVVLVLLLCGGSTVAVASNSMPDEALYPVKIATEKVRLALTFSDIGKADLHARLADRRVNEIIAIASRAEPDKLDEITNRLNTHLTMVASLSTTETMQEKSSLLGVLEPAPTQMPAPTPTPPGTGAAQDESEYTVNGRLARLRVLVGQSAATNLVKLRETLRTAPESSKPALRRALAIAEARYQQALEAVDETRRGQ